MESESMMTTKNSQEEQFAPNHNIDYNKRLSTIIRTQNSQHPGGSNHSGSELNGATPKPGRRTELVQSESED